MLGGKTVFRDPAFRPTFDDLTGELASTRVYDDAREAAVDADLLENVMVVGFTMEHVPAGSDSKKEGT